MYFGVKVRVNVATMAEFGAALAANALDRTAIASETFCLADDPAVGYSVWQAADHDEFEAKFAGWRPYYAEVEVRELIPPAAAMQRLASQPGDSAGRGAVRT